MLRHFRVEWKQQLYDYGGREYTTLRKTNIRLHATAVTTCPKFWALVFPRSSVISVPLLSCVMSFIFISW